MTMLNLSKWRRSEMWLLPGIFLLSLFLRVYCLDCYSLWYDEVASIEVAQRGLNAIFNDRFGWMNVQTPLHYLQVWLTIQPVDPTTTSILVRLPSALAGALTPLLVYALGRELFGRAQGVIAALMFTLGATLLDYAQDIRPYSLFAFLTALSIYCLLRAERTGSIRWWSAFTLASVLNLLNSYHALVLFLPCLILYLLVQVWRLWSNKQEGKRQLVSSLLAMAALGLTALPMFLELSRLPRTTPELSKVSALSFVTTGIELLVWFTRFGLAERAEQVLQLGFFMLAVLGVYAAVLRKEYKGITLCVLIILVPTLVLALLSTTNVLGQRYAYFVGPFYFLLIANGLVFIPQMGSRMTTRPRAQRAIKIASVGIGVLVAAAFIIGAYRFATPAGHRVISYRPDFRETARYLAKVVTQEDMVLIADDKGLGQVVANFYWHEAPPGITYDVCDPRRFLGTGARDIYWVLGTYDGPLVDYLVSNNTAGSQVARYSGVTVMLDTQKAKSTIERVELITRLFEAQRPDHAVTKMLRGGIDQVLGNAEHAAAAYAAGSDLPQLSSEYLLTAGGFLDRGDPGKAWREASIAKFMDSSNPEVHRWMSRRLSEEGHRDQAQVQDKIADLLLGVP